MNIFKKINDQQNNAIELPVDPNDLFYNLKKDKEFSYLRGIQEETLKTWHSKRDNPYVLIKMNTGAGKTLVGLLMLYSKMIESQQKTLFLCPDKQLVSQVHEQSKKYNIPTCVIDDDNEFPEEFLNKKSILITTVQKLFNGKNIFDKQKIDIDSIVIDDAHKCVEKVRDMFSIKFKRNHPVYNQLKELFSSELKKQSLGTFESIEMEERMYYMKLPFWSWIDNRDKVIKIFSDYITEQDTLLFKWDLFHNNYNQYELYIKSSHIEICPIKCYVDNIQTYTNAKYIYALSATFENDASLIYDLNFSLESVLYPIEPKDRKDYGQRLILTPERYFPKFNKQNLTEIIEHHLKNEENILVLVPTYRDAEIWEKLGAKIISNDIETEIRTLKKSKGNFIVLANRYDGIDLGGDTCNVLIVYEHPRYKFIKDEFYETILHKKSTNIIAQTIEQGMGRTVRSGNDYSVVYLFGRNILRFLRYKENFEYLNKHTSKQIEMGLDLLSSDEIKEADISKAIYETADFCLAQDKEWLKYYQNYMKDLESTLGGDREAQLKIKDIERKAIIKFIEGNNQVATDLIREILNFDLPDSEKAIYYTLLSNLIYQIDKGKANDLILKARNYSRHMFEPFLSQEYVKKQLPLKNQYNNALKYVQSFSTINDAINSFREVILGLMYSPNNKAEDFEESVKQLGKILGFDSSRPEKEKKEGSDNLWLMSDKISLVMEAKSEKLHKNLISKSDVSQLMHSISWFKRKFISDDITCLGVTLQFNGKAENDVVSDDSIRVLDSSSLDEIKKYLTVYIEFLSKKKLSELTENEIKNEFNSYSFGGKGFVSKYLKSIN